MKQTKRQHNFLKFAAKSLINVTSEMGYFIHIYAASLQSRIILYGISTVLIFINHKFIDQEKKKKKNVISNYQKRTSNESE